MRGVIVAISLPIWNWNDESSIETSVPKQASFQSGIAGKFFVINISSSASVTGLSLRVFKMGAPSRLARNGFSNQRIGRDTNG
jgi:hypothetical protein